MVRATLVPVCILLLSAFVLPGQGGASEQFWEAHQAYHQMRSEVHQTRRKKRLKGGEYHKVEDQAIEKYIKQWRRKKGDDVEQMVRHAQYHLYLYRIKYYMLKYDVEEYEEELRDWWKKEHLPDKRQGLEYLYDRFWHDKRFSDASRVALEACEKYDWSWTYREWLDRLIDASFEEGKAAEIEEEREDAWERMCERIDEFADNHMDELDDSTLHTNRRYLGRPMYLHDYLGYLREAEAWDQAAAVVNACLKTYKVCDWQPRYLEQAVLTHTGRYDAQQEKPAEDKKKSRRSRRKSEREPGDSLRLAFASMLRLVKRYPSSTEAAEAMKVFLPWAQEVDDEGARKQCLELAALFMREHPANHRWQEVLGRARPLIRDGVAPWPEIEALRAEVEAKEQERLDAYIALFPDSHQARRREQEEKRAAAELKQQRIKEAMEKAQAEAEAAGEKTVQEAVKKAKADGQDEAAAEKNAKAEVAKSIQEAKAAAKQAVQDEYEKAEEEAKAAAEAEAKKREEELEAMTPQQRLDLRQNELEARFEGMKKLLREYPNSPEGRETAWNLLEMVTAKDMEHMKERWIPQTASVFKETFKEAPAFRSALLQTLAMQEHRQFADSILENLKNETESELQRRWYAYLQARRSTLNYGTNVPLVHKWMKADPECYFVPDVLQDVCRNAVYNGQKPLASKACEVLDQERYTPSKTMLNLVSSNLHEWLRHKRKVMEDKMLEGGGEDDDARGRNRGKKSKNQSPEERIDEEADRQANIYDAALYKRINVGRLYYCARNWPRGVIKLDKQRDRSPKDALRSKRYEKTFWYYMANADKR